MGSNIFIQILFVALFANFTSTAIWVEKFGDGSEVPLTSLTGNRPENAPNILQEAENLISLEKLREEIRRRLAIYKSEIYLVHDLEEIRNNKDSEYENEQDESTALGILGNGHNSSTITTSNSRSSKIRRAVITASNVLPGRKRRNITHTYEAGGSEVVSRIYRRHPQPFDFQALADLNVLLVDTDTYLLSLECPSSASESLVIYKVEKGLNPREIIRKSTPHATTLETVRVNGQYYVIVAQYNEVSKDTIDAGSQVYQIDFVRNELVNVQWLNIDFTRSVNTWIGTGEEANDIFLGVAPEFTKSSIGKGNRVNILVYRWQGGYFDFVYSIPASNPQATSYANIESHGYLAVANYQDDAKSSSIYSEIFKYNHKEYQYVSSQKILTHGAKDIQFFSLTSGYQEEHFLAIANYVKTDANGKTDHRVKSYVLKYTNGRFIPFQRLDTFGAYQILQVKEAQNKFLLMFAELHGISVYQYNGWKLTQTFFFRLGEDSTSNNFLKLRTFVYDSQPFITIASRTKEVQGGVYGLEFERKSHSKLSLNVEKWCLATLAEVKSVNISRLVERSESAPKVSDDKIVLSASLVFTKHTRVQDLFTKKLTCGSRVYDAELSSQLADRETQLKYLRSQSVDIFLKIKQVVTRDETQFVNTQVTFNHVDYNGEVFKAKEVSSVSLNGINIDDLTKNAIRLDSNNEFKNVVVTEVIANRKTEVHKLNGLSISSFALKSSNSQTFTEVNKFEVESFSTGGFHSNGLVDSLDFTNIDFLLNKGNQTFRVMNLRESTTNNLLADFVNDVNIKYYMDEAVTASGDETITGAKDFYFIKVEEWNAHIINRRHMDFVFEYALRLSSSENKFDRKVGKIRFEHITAESVEIEDSSVNKDVTIDKLISISTGTFQHLKTMDLLTDTSVKELFVQKSLNHLEVKDGKLDIILKSSKTPQFVSNKVLDTIILEKDSHAQGLVDNLKLEGWSPILELELKDNHMRVGKIRTEGCLTIPGGIHIDALSSRFSHNKNDVTRVLKSALRLDAKELPANFHGKLIFESINVKGDSKVLSTINGLKTSDWLLNKHGAEDETVRITGWKVFNQDLKLLSPSTAQELYGTAELSTPNILKGFQDILIDGLDQTITRNSKFTELLQVENLECPLLELNGVQIKDLMLTTGDQEIQGKLTFLKQIRTRNKFKINGNLKAENINGHNLTAEILDTLRTSSRILQIISGEINFEDEFRVEKLNLKGRIGGHKASDLFENIILSDAIGPQHVAGSVTFSKESELDQLVYTGDMNGISYEDWGEGFLLQSGRQTITTPTTFTNSIKADSIHILNAKVSNFDLERFNSEFLRTDTGGSLGVVYFENKIDIGKNVILVPEATVNGYNLRRDILLKNTEKPQNVTGHKLFKKGPNILGDLSVNFLYGFPFKQAALFAFEKTSLTDNLRIEGNLKLKDELFFSESINEESWSKLTESVWWLGEDEIIDSHVEFSNGFVLENGASLQGLLNEVDISALSEDYLSKSKDQTIKGSVLFGHGVTFESLKVGSITLKNGGKVNSIDLKKFRDKVLLNGVDQNIGTKMSFEKLKIQNIMLEDKSLVGGIDLGRNSMTLHGDNDISGEFTFGDLMVGLLQLDKITLLNGIDLERWKTSSVKLNEIGTTNIRGLVHFQMATFSKGVTVLGLVNGLNYSRANIFTLSDDQVIEGNYTFVQDKDVTAGSFVATKGFKVDGDFNGFDILKAIKTLIRDDGSKDSLQVSGVKKFNQELDAQSVEAEGLFQENDLNAIIRDIEAMTREVPAKYKFSLEEKYQALTKSADELLKISARRAVLFHDFELANKIWATSVKKVRTVNIFGSPKVILITQKSTERETACSGTYSEATNSYREDSFLDLSVTGKFRDIAEIQRGNEHFLFVVLSSVDGEIVTTLDTTIELTTRDFEIEKSDKLSKTLILRSRQGEKTGLASSYSISQIIYADDFGNTATLALFEADESHRDCVVSLIMNTEGSKVLVLCFPTPKDSTLQITQTLRADNPSLVSTMEIKNFKTLLLIANKNEDDNSGVVDVYGHSKGSHQFLKEDCIPTVNLVSMDASRGFNNNAHLALASGYVKNSLSFGHVIIYRYSNSKKQFVKQQSIPVDDPLAVKFQLLTLSKDIFLYVLKKSSYRNLQVYTFRGSSGWSLEHTLTTEAGQQLETASFIFNRINHAKLFVFGNGEVNTFDLEFNGLYQQNDTSKSNSNMNSTEKSTYLVSF